MITIDRRELAEAEEHHPDISVTDILGTDLYVDTLDAGDYAFLDRNSEPLGIERCEIGNLVQKLRSGELEDQMTRCSEQYASIVLLIEGIWDEAASFLAHYRQTDKGYFRTRIEPHIRYAEPMAAIIRLSELGIEIVQTPNFQCSLATIKTIYNQRTKPEEEHRMFKQVRKPFIPVKLSANPAVPRLLALCPRLPEKTAIRLIHKYGSIWNIINADEKELLEIEGFGKTLIRRLKGNIGYGQ